MGEARVDAAEGGDRFWSVWTFSPHHGGKPPDPGRALCLMSTSLLLALVGIMCAGRVGKREGMSERFWTVWTL